MDNNFETYISQIQNLFGIVENKTVLEIAAFDGHHTKIILHYKPKDVTIVEANLNACTVLQEKFKNCHIVADDIFNYLHETHNFDIVVCCGLLYHLHNPLHLLELIANNANPSYIILETIVTKDERNADFLDEQDNLPGNRQVPSNFKSTRLYVTLPERILNKAMANLGYFLRHKKTFNDDVHESKRHVIMTVWTNK